MIINIMNESENRALLASVASILVNFIVFILFLKGNIVSLDINPLNFVFLALAFRHARVLELHWLSSVTLGVLRGTECWVKIWYLAWMIKIVIFLWYLWRWDVIIRSRRLKSLVALTGLVLFHIFQVQRRHLNPRWFLQRVIRRIISCLLFGKLGWE